MHSVQMICLIAAVLVFGCVLSSPLAWARHSQQHFQRPISHSNHAALLRYYSTPYQLRPQLLDQTGWPHFETGPRHHHPRELQHTPHSGHGHQENRHDFFIEFNR